MPTIAGCDSILTESRLRYRMPACAGVTGPCFRPAINIVF
jgi:hypothetical protein